MEMYLHYRLNCYRDWPGMQLFDSIGGNDNSAHVTRNDTASRCSQNEGLDAVQMFVQVELFRRFYDVETEYEICKCLFTKRVGG